MCSNVDLEAFKRTYLFHCAQKGVKPRHHPEHRCSRGKCCFWTHPKAPLTYMCEASCTIHQCGPKCTFPPIQTPEADLVCPLTGVVLHSRLATTVFTDSERTLTHTEYSPSDQKDRRWQRWELYATTLMKRAVNINENYFVSCCIVIYENLLKEKSGFFRNSINDFGVFCIAMAFLCKTGVPQAGIPKLRCVQSFPDPQELPKKKVNLTYFNKTVRHIVKQTQKEQAKQIFSSLKKLTA